VENIERTNKTPTYRRGDYIKAEFTQENSGESEWMWVKVDYCDDEREIVFGWLDNEPVTHGGKLKVGQQLAISYDNVRDHRKDLGPRATRRE